MQVFLAEVDIHARSQQDVVTRSPASAGIANRPLVHE